MSELFLRNTTGEACSVAVDGDKFDLVAAQGVAATVAESSNATAFEEVLHWNLTVGAAGKSGVYPISLNVASVDGNMQYRLRLQRVNAACVVQDSSEYTVEFNSSGIKRESILFESTFVATDVLRLSLEAKRLGASGAKTITVNINDEDSTIDEPSDEQIITRELFSSREGDSDAQTFRYLVSGSDDGEAMRAQLLLDSPSFHDTVSREDQKIDLNRIDTLKWLAEISYKKAPPAEQLEKGDQIFTFDTGGGTTHITNSIATANKYPGGAPDFKGAILVHKGGIDGVDVVVPSYRFTEVKVLTAAQVSSAYKAIVFGLTGQTNDASFKGFSAKEVLFMGAQGQQRGDDGWEVTFNFAASPNLTGLTFGDVVAVAKKGWEFLWVNYKDIVDANVLVKQPKSVHVETIYDEGDFSALLIGT